VRLALHDRWRMYDEYQIENPSRREAQSVTEPNSWIDMK